MTEYLLFKRKVNPNTLGKDNWSPIEIAVQTGILEIVQLILQDERLNLREFSSFRGTPLHLSASVGDFKISNMLLLRAPFLIIIKDSQDRTPIEVAVGPKVIGLLTKYQESYKGDVMTFEIENEPGRAIDKVTAGALDQIIEEEEDLDNVESYARSP